METMVAMGVMSVGAVVMAQLYTNQLQQQKSIQIKANIEALRATIQNTAKDPDSLRFTANQSLGSMIGVPINPIFKRCLTNPINGPTTGPNACDSNLNPLPTLRLFSRDGQELNGRYRSDGSHCPPNAQAGTDCPFRVSFTFKAICPQNPALTVNGQCARAQKVQVLWKIEQETLLKGIIPVTQLEADLNNSTSGLYAVPISTQNIAATANLEQECLPVTLTAAMIAPTGPYAQKYQPLVGQSFPQIVTAVDTYGQQVCGYNMAALDAELLRRDMCRVQIQQAWNGSIDPGAPEQSTSPSCNIKVKKIFKLAGSTPGSTTGRLTNQCTGSNFVEFRDGMSGGQVVSNLSSLKGGIVEDLYGNPLTPAQVAQLITDYGLDPNTGDNRIFCRYTAATCPSPFLPYQNWTATNPKENCNALRGPNGSGVNYNLTCTSNSNIDQIRDACLQWCNSNMAALGNGHDFANTAPEPDKPINGVFACGQNGGGNTCGPGGWNHELGNSYNCTLAGYASRCACFSGIPKGNCPTVVKSRGCS